MANDERYSRYDDTNAFYADEFGERLSSYDDVSDDAMPTDEQLMADDTDTTGLDDVMMDDEPDTDFRERLVGEPTATGDTATDSYGLTRELDDVTPPHSRLDAAEHDALADDEDAEAAPLR